jgi:hypothetical protein
MKHVELDKIIQEANERRGELLASKNADYANNQDALSAFKSPWNNCSIPPTAAWYVLFDKHIRNLQRYVRAGNLESSKIVDVLDDMRNYLDFLEALLREQNRI